MRLVLALCALLLLPACSDSGSGSDDAPDAPPVSAFADGTCRAAAPHVLALGAAGERLGDEATVPADVKTQLREAQSALAELAVAAEPAYKPAFDALVASTGAVRIRADGNSYAKELGDRMMKDYDAAVAACT